MTRDTLWVEINHVIRQTNQGRGLVQRIRPDLERNPLEVRTWLEAFFVALDSGYAVICIVIATLVGEYMVLVYYYQDNNYEFILLHGRR